MTVTTPAPGLAPICPTCKIRECVLDYEPGHGYGYYKTCSRCLSHSASAPRCMADDHGGSVKTLPVIVEDELVGFTCPDCKRSASWTGWTTAAARHWARETVTNCPDLLSARRALQERALMTFDPAFTRAQTLVYAREFLLELDRLS